MSPSSSMLGKVNLLASLEDARHFAVLVDVRLSQLVNKSRRRQTFWVVRRCQIRYLVSESSRRQEIRRPLGYQVRSVSLLPSRVDWRNVGVLLVVRSVS